MGFLPDMCDYFVDEVMNDPDYLRDIAYMYGGKGSSFNSLVKKVFGKDFERKCLLLRGFKWLNSKNELVDIREIDDNYYEKLRDFILKNKIIEYYEIDTLDDERILHKIRNNENYDVLNMNCGNVIKTIINNSLIIDDKVDPRELRSFKLFDEDVGVYQGNIFFDEENINRRTICFHDRLIGKRSSNVEGLRYVKTFVLFEEGKNTFREQIIERVYELRKYFSELKYIDEAIEMQTSNNSSIKD